jgi:hypothetical protein
MDLSDALSALNVARYEAWSPKFTAQNAKQAVLAFNGDVYDGLSAKTLSEADLDWLHEHLGILSGLYGVLRPLDLMQPYRLEMGTQLPTSKGKNLYQCWGSTIAEHHRLDLKQGRLLRAVLHSSDRPAQWGAMGTNRGFHLLTQVEAGLAFELQQQGEQLHAAHFWYWPNWAS